MNTHTPIEPLTITATEFKAKCLGILDRLAARELSEVKVTKRGKVVAVLTPPRPAPADDPDSVFGCLKDQTLVAPGVDLTEPTSHLVEWDSLRETQAG
jgi:antitoxin (DNA-binding transcriptional repressor) of toxin-antitoxin stability system